MPLQIIAKPRFIPLLQNIPKGLQQIVAKMGYNPLQKIAMSALAPSMRYHCCNKCLVCAAVVELIERSHFMKFEPEIVKQIIEG